MAKEKTCPIEKIVSAIHTANSTGLVRSNGCTEEACAWWVEGFPTGCAIKIKAEQEGKLIG